MFNIVIRINTFFGPHLNRYVDFVNLVYTVDTLPYDNCLVLYPSSILKWVLFLIIKSIKNMRGAG